MMQFLRNFQTLYKSYRNKVFNHYTNRPHHGSMATQNHSLTVIAHSSLLTPICTQGSSSDCQATFSVRLIMNSINRVKSLWHKTHNYVRQDCFCQHILTIKYLNPELRECLRPISQQFLLNFTAIKNGSLAVNKIGHVCMR